MIQIIISACLSFMAMFALICTGRGRKDSDKKELGEKAVFKVKHRQSTHLNESSTLVISCVDFNLKNIILNFLDKNLCLKDDYDEISLPGASLAISNPPKKYWKSTISDIITILVQLHKVRRIIFIDHMDCKMFKLMKNKLSYTKERGAHLCELQIAKCEIKKMFPMMKINSFLIGLDGNVEEIDLTLTVVQR
jgi:hypothetical protein